MERTQKGFLHPPNPPTPPWPISIPLMVNNNYGQTHTSWGFAPFPQRLIELCVNYVLVCFLFFSDNIIYTATQWQPTTKSHSFPYLIMKLIVSLDLWQRVYWWIWKSSASRVLWNITEKKANWVPATQSKRNYTSQLILWCELPPFRQFNYTCKLPHLFCLCTLEEAFVNETLKFHRHSIPGNHKGVIWFLCHHKSITFTLAIWAFWCLRRRALVSPSSPIPLHYELKLSAFCLFFKCFHGGRNVSQTNKMFTQARKGVVFPSTSQQRT